MRPWKVIACRAARKSRIPGPSRDSLSVPTPSTVLNAFDTALANHLLPHALFRSIDTSAKYCLLRHFIFYQISTFGSMFHKVTVFIMQMAGMGSSLAELFQVAFVCKAMEVTWYGSKET